MKDQHIYNDDQTERTRTLGSVSMNSSDLIFDYSAFLFANNSSFVKLNSWLLVGEQPLTEGWLLHISVVPQQMNLLMDRISDHLLANDISFIIPGNREQHNHVLDGRAGLMAIGKVINIYLGNHPQPELFAKELVKVSQGITGPAVVTAVPLSKCVFVSHGKLIQEETVNMRYYSPLFGYQPVKYLTDLLHLNRNPWPFQMIVPFDKHRKTRIIAHQYLPVIALKSDAKGNVLKCIRLNRIFNMHWCVLKQGKRNQCYDNHGRDMISRLEWQYECHLLLVDKVRLPKVFDLFISDGDAWLSMEYIDGVPLNAKINEIHEGIAWLALTQSLQVGIINYLFQVIEILERFHANGFVHRDLNPGNFLVGRKGEVTPIDIELAYNLNKNEPSPAFTVGTQGYISPQQLHNETPEIADDLFGLGALLIKSFTGFSPNKFNVNDAEFQEDLYYFIGFSPMSEVIAKCLKHARDERPNLSDVKSCLVEYQSFLTNVPVESRFLISHQENLESKKITVEKAIRALNTEIMLGDSHQWLAIADNHSGLLANEYINFSWNPGMYSGIAGILYTLSLADKLGLATVELIELISLNQSYLTTEIADSGSLRPGLWHGQYGIAFALKSLIDTDFLENGPYQIDRIYRLLIKDCAGLNLAEGKAGQGMAMLQCMDIPKFPSLWEELTEIVSFLIYLQEKDGSWLVSAEPGQPNVKMLGFGYGTAGIICFLLQYYKRNKKQEVKTAITKALNWLIKQRIKVGGKWIWPVNPKNKLIDPWLDYGFSGVALTFIHAYEILKEPFYKEVATADLLIHPKYIASNYLTMANGLSGLGEIYLEAFRVFGEQEWQERAEHIAELLTHNCKKASPEIFYWLDGNNSRPAAGLMNGNSGIVHFLLRCLYPQKIHFPMFKPC
jgi:serine/threonine protein kinase